MFIIIKLLDIIKKNVVIMFINTSRVIYSVVFLSLLCLCSASVTQGAELVVRDHSYMGRDFTYGQHWSAFSVKKANEEWVTDLTLDDFQLTEAIVSLTEGVLETREIDIEGQAQDRWEDAGLWERSVGEEKMDIVFLVDVTGSMSAAMPGIVSEIHAFVDRLIEHHINFRVAVVYFICSIEYDVIEFKSILEVDRLHEDIDYWNRTHGESWSPSVAYDALLFTSWLGFRQDAKKICVVITDIVPQTVYGTRWYPVSCTAATLSAVELYLADTGIELYYCQNPEDHSSIEFYTDPNINPRAGDEQSGFKALQNKGLATQIDWPFDQIQLPVPYTQVTDSQYYLAWETTFDWDSAPDLHDHPENYRIAITAQVPDADQPGESLATTYTCTLTRQTADVIINVTDERGNPFNDLWAYLYYPMGDRLTEQYYQVHPEEGQIDMDPYSGVPIGPYFLDINAAQKYGYTKLRAIAREWIEVPSGGLTLDVQVATADRESELAKARGLLKDLDDWRVSGDPFKEFVAEAEAWLNQLEAQGITWKEMTAIKRFYVALSGYANITEYAQLETEGAIEDFHRIVHDFRDIIARVEEIQKSADDSWDDALAGWLLEIVYDFFSGGEFTVLKEAVEEGIETLLEYAQGELQDELKDHVVEQIPVGSYGDLIKDILYICIDADFEDWEAIVEAAEDMLIAEALDEVLETVGENFVEELFSDLDAVKPLLLKKVIEAIVEEGFDDFDEILEEFADEIGPFVLQEGREKVVDTVNDVFDELDAQLGPGDVRDFLMGMARDLVLVSIPEVENEGLNHQIDSDAVVAALVKHGIYNVVLRHYYVEQARAGMYEVLYRARCYVPTGEESRMMHRDFFDYREIVGSLQDTSWNALSEQEGIDDWASCLEVLVAILDPLSEALDAIAAIYSPLEDTADAVNGFIASLATGPDSVQILTRAIEFGLKVHCLDTFGNQVEPLRKTIFPDGTGDVALTRLDISPATYDFGSVPIGKYSQAVKITLWNTGNVDIPISSVYLTDPGNFEIVQGLDDSIISACGHADLLVRFRPSGIGAFYDTGLGVTSTIAGLEVQEIQLRGNNIKLNPIKPIPQLHIVGMCDTVCQLGAPITVADSVTDVNINYTAPVEVIGGVMSEDFSTVWWLNDSCTFSTDFGQAVTDAVQLSCTDVAMPAGGAHGWVFWLVAPSATANFASNEWWSTGVYELMWYQFP